MIGRTPDARRIIDVPGLNDDEFVQSRARWFRIVALARLHDPALYQQLLAFPDDLPNLAALRPPGGNSRPEGIEQSHFAQQRRGELAATY